MEKLDIEQLSTLKWGDTVYRWDRNNFRKLRFVGTMPGSTQYLIFCDGEYLTSLYLDLNKNQFNHDWYQGKYSSAVVGTLKLQELEYQRESITKIYFK